MTLQTLPNSFKVNNEGIKKLHGNTIYQNKVINEGIKKLRGNAIYQNQRIVGHFAICLFLFLSFPMFNFTKSFYVFLIFQFFLL